MIGAENDIREGIVEWMGIQFAKILEPSATFEYIRTNVNLNVAVLLTSP